MGVRKWIYDYAHAQNVDRVIDLLVDGFLLGVPATLHKWRQGDGKAVESNVGVELSSPVEATNHRGSSQQANSVSGSYADQSGKGASRRKAADRR
jgi:hypothetical protein